VTDPLVVDSSVAIKWYFDEPGSDRAAEILGAGWALHAPELLLLECDAVLCTEVRRGNLAAGTMQGVRAELRRSGLQFHPVADLLDAGVLASIAAGKALYDCVYLALAQTLDATLVTADARFAAGLTGTRLGSRIRLLEDV
jgi:predicted nucleic acid-binding protein